MMEIEGLLIKAVGGFYYVSANGATHVCKARGVLRREGLSPVVGDRVLIETHASGYAQLNTVLPRRNLLKRPSVANLDELFIVLSAHTPEPDWLLADKLILAAKCMDVLPIPVLNKTDEADEAIRQAFRTDYALFERLEVSAADGSGLDALQEAAQGKVCCFAGQSAVGKSSLLNRLLPELSLSVGALSEKTERGKHTTRHAELWPFNGGALLDTPGFSLYESELLSQQELDACYPEFALSEGCRFPSCHHRGEPAADCGVKRLIGNSLSEARYARYILILDEMEQRRKHQYD